MIPGILAAVSVLVLGIALRPRPMPRLAAPSAPLPDPVPRRRRSPNPLHARRSTVDPGDLAVWCDALARALRGGATLHHALRSIEPPPVVDEQLAPAMLALERGASVAGAFADLETRSPHLDLVVVVLRACAEHGGAAAEPIDRAASALRQRAALAGERRTQSAQARMSAIVMTLLPGAMLAMLLTTSGAVRRTALSPTGLSVIACGAALNLAGWWWMRRLIAGAVR